MSERESIQLKEADTYLRGLVDFVKWSSAITIGAMLWIGDNIVSIQKTLPQYFAIVALSLLFLSLVFAGIATLKIVVAWGKEWAFANARLSLLIFGKEVELLLPNALTKLEAEISDQSELERRKMLKEIEFEKERMELLTQMMEMDEKRKPFSHPESFNTWLTVYAVFLLLGLLLYALAQIINVLL